MFWAVAVAVAVAVAQTVAWSNEEVQEKKEAVGWELDCAPVLSAVAVVVERLE
jgi:hypothetical protein